MPKKTILSTAGLPPESLAMLAEAGLDCRIVPCIEIRLLTNEPHRHPTTELVRQQCNVIFTSANAVEAVVEMLPPGSRPGWKIYCLEGKTAATVQLCLPTCTIVATEKDSATLAEHPETAGEQTFHFFCGGSRMDTLPKLLQQRGKTVYEYIVYETIHTEPQLDFSPHAALYFSPSAIQSLSAKNDLATIPLHVCIGKSTAAAIPAALQSRVRIAAKHSKESAVAALLETIKNNPDIC